MLAAILFACQCAATTPRATIGGVAQTAEAIYLSTLGGIVRIDKTTGAELAATPPIPRAVSAIDVDGGTLWFGTRTTVTTGFFPNNDGPNENYIGAMIDNVLTILVAHRADIQDLHHDATYLYWTEGPAMWRRARDGGAVEMVGMVERTAPPTRVALQRVSSSSTKDSLALLFGPWMLYDETVFIDPHVSAVHRYASNLCESTPPVQLWGAAYHTTPPVDPIPTPPPTAIDACGIFIGAERKICFAPQTLAVDALEIFRYGLVPSQALRSTGGDLVVIHGRGFDGTTTVDIDGKPAPVIVGSDTALSVAAPQIVPGKSPISVALRVRNGAGDCTAALVTVADPRGRAAGR